MNPVKGMKFLHKAWLDTESFDGKSPQLFQVSKVARGVVYYRPVYKDGLGKPMCCAIEDFGKYVKCSVKVNEVTGNGVRVSITQDTGKDMARLFESICDRLENVK